jgi:UDP-N-acetylmuramate dehydrogenase
VKRYQHYPLKQRHTFGIELFANQYVECENEQDVLHLIEQGVFKSAFFILGGGSNVLFYNEFQGAIIHPVMNKIGLLRQDESHVWVSADAGVVWDDFVAYCVENEYYGVENLSYIPGHVGASPVQNVGAYGVEACDCIDHVSAIDLTTGHRVELTNEACRFGYRDSIFKNELKNRVMVTNVVFKLSLTPDFNLDYGQIKEEIAKRGEVTLQNVRHAIIYIRQSKLPDPQVVGNAGSFFKNPVVSSFQANVLLDIYPKMPHYQIDDELVKIPAGWLIETAGWKGKSIGNVAVHDKQALVIINKGQATTLEVNELAKAIEDDILLKFNIELEREVNFIR